MGDALATYFEARACKNSGAATCAGGLATSAAMALAELCFHTLMEEGVKAKLALEAGACTPAAEKIIEANTLLSGIGFESGGLFVCVDNGQCAAGSVCGSNGGADQHRNRFVESNRLGGV